MGGQIESVHTSSSVIYTQYILVLDHNTMTMTHFQNKSYTDRHRSGSSPPSGTGRASLTLKQQVCEGVCVRETMCLLITSWHFIWKAGLCLKQNLNLNLDLN